MTDYSKLRKILNGSNMSVKHYQKGKISVTDSQHFKGMSTSALEEAQQLVVDSIKTDTFDYAKNNDIHIDTLDGVSKRAKENIGIVMDCILSGKPTTADEMHRTAMRNAIVAKDSIQNGRWNINNPADPTKASFAMPNVYISPWQANALYSQKGLFETVINKKSKSILLNGCVIENKHLSQKQMDDVNERAEVKHNFKNILSEATMTSLVYGGDLVFPLFKKDTPVTTMLNLGALLKLGVLEKNCIDYFVQLDRWNMFIIPPYNPTQKDFLRPEVSHRPLNTNPNV